MIGHDRFSALRLRHIFPQDVLDAARGYFAAPDEGPRFCDESYMGGSWGSEEIDGASLWFPKRRRGQVGIVKASGGPYPDATAVAGRPQPFYGPFLDPAWLSNADRLLAALEIGLRIGGREEAVAPLAAGHLRRADFSDGARRFLSFALRAPDPYHVQTIFHDKEGLLYLEIRRPDLLRLNEYDKGGYDSCFAGLYDEG
jgi:hypothetical protein